MNDLVDFVEGFMKGYNALKPEEKNYFMQHFLDEVKKSRPTNQSENFIDTFLEEIRSVQEQEKGLNQTQDDFIESFINEIQNHQRFGDKPLSQESQQEIAPHQSHTSQSQTFVLPLGFNYFNSIVNQKIDLLFEKHQDELQKLGFIQKQKMGDDEIVVFDRESLFSKEQMQEFKKEYAKSYLEAIGKKNPSLQIAFVDLNSKEEAIVECRDGKNLNQETFLELIKNNPIDVKDLNLQWLRQINTSQIQTIKKDFEPLKNDFIETIEKEYQSISQDRIIAPQVESKQNTQSNSNAQQAAKEQHMGNNEPQYASLSDWFEKIKIEHKNFKLSKQDFKERFIKYCQNNMNENEMKILLIMANKKPSNLTLEHQELIKNGLEASNTNSNLMDKGLQCCIRAQIGEKLSTQDHGLMQEFLKTHSCSAEPINKKLSEVFAQKLNSIQNLKTAQKNSNSMVRRR